MVELKVQDFDKNKKFYLNVHDVLSQKFNDETVPINHVGSTAIPNMVGKNIIDVLVGAKNQAEFKKLYDIIADLGFFASQNSKNEIYQFFASKQGETGEGDVHIHLVITDTERYDEFLILRDYLLSHPQEAEAYSNLKKTLIEQGITDRKQYRATKSEYVSALIERAKQNLSKQN